MRRRDFLSTSLAAGLTLAAAPRPSLGQSTTGSEGGSFFRILTGSAHTTAFPVGTTIATAISNPPG
ncbi:MAG: twin-arginine translocation signal domain-containing protein, partial [Gammaproteobacteria bacterium]